MHIEETSPTPTTTVFLVHFPVSELHKHVDTFLKVRARSFKKDGFRPGKVPLDIVRIHCSQEAERWAEEQLAQEGWNALRKKHTDKQWPGINNFEFDRTDPAFIKVRITCETWPTLNLEDGSLPSFERFKITVSDDTVQKWIPSMLEQLVVHEPQKKDYAAQQNDLVCVNLFFRHKGKEINNSRVMNSFIELTPARLAIFKESPFANLFDKIIGAKEGDSIKESFKATKDYCWGQRRLIDQRIECECRIISIEKFKAKPTLKDLGERFGVDEKDVADYVRQGFQDYADLLEAMHNKRMVFDHLNSVFNFDVHEHRWKEEALRIAHAYEGDSTEQENEEIAKRRVRLGIIVEQLRSQCGNITSDIINKGVELYSLTHQLDPVVVFMWVRRAGNNPNRLNEQGQADWQNIMSAINEWNVAHHVIERMQSKTPAMDWKECQKKWQDVLPTHFLDDNWAIRYVLTKKQRDEFTKTKEEASTATAAPKKKKAAKA